MPILPRDAKIAREFRAEGIGLTQNGTYVFPGRQDFCGSSDDYFQYQRAERKSLNKLLPMQEEGFLRNIQSNGRSARYY